jgi:hypothetical protein
MLLLLVAVLLALLPLLGIALIVVNGFLFTVDGLFMTLILLSMSAAFFFNVALELRRRGLVPGLTKPAAPATAASPSRSASAAPVANRPAAEIRAAAAPPQLWSAAAGETQTHTGIVERVEFFEAPVGASDKTLVYFRADKAAAPLLWTVCGDVRNQLQPHKRVTVTLRAGDGCASVLAIDYR